MTRVQLSLAILAAAAALTACSAPQDVTAPLALCIDSIRVSATAGLTPTFDWTPRCGLAAISVLAPPSLGSPTGEIWWIEANGQLIAPGIRYGDTPAGTKTVTPPLPPASGRDYIVSFVAELGKPAVAVMAWRP